jgi:uncharacterized protein
MKFRNIKSPEDQIEAFCAKWESVELALIGSVLRDDFRDDSDVDVLVTFAPNAQRSLFDHVDMQEELEGILGRRIDLVSRKAVEGSRNYIRREAILGSSEVIYAAS